MSEGKCTTCRNYKQDANGHYCAVGVADRPRGAAAALYPCGWWKRRYRKRKSCAGEAEG